MSKNYLVQITLAAKDMASGVFGKVSTSAGGAFAQMKAMAKDNTAELDRLGNRATLAGGAIVGALALAGNKSAGFGNELAEIGTLGEAAAGHLDQYRASVMKMAVDYGQATGSLNKAIYDSVSAGIDAAKADEFVAKASKLATVGRVQTSQSVDLLTTALKNYGAGADEAEHYSDVLFATVQQGKTTISELQASLGQVAPAASMANVGIEEVGAAMATLTSSTGNTAISATGLKAALVATVAPSDALAAALKRHGYASGEAALKAVGLAGVMKIVGEESGGSSTKIQELYPGMEALSAVSVLAANNAGTLSEKLEAVRDSAGVTTREFKRMAKEPAFRMQQARAAFEVSSIAIGQSIQSILAPIASVSAGLLGFIARHQWLANTIAWVGVTVGGALLAVGAFAKGMTLYRSVVESAGTVTEIWTRLRRGATVATEASTVAEGVNAAAKESNAAASATASAADEFEGLMTEELRRHLQGETAAEIQNAAAKRSNAAASATAGSADLARGGAAIGAAGRVRGAASTTIAAVGSVVAAGGMAAATILGMVAAVTAAVVAVPVGGLGNWSELWGGGRRKWEESQGNLNQVNRYLQSSRKLERELGRKPTLEELMMYDPEALTPGQTEGVRRNQALQSIRMQEQIGAEMGRLQSAGMPAVPTVAPTDLAIAAVPSAETAVHVASPIPQPVEIAIRLDRGLIAEVVRGVLQGDGWSVSVGQAY